ncbi:MAG: hypothetical protein RL322_1251 [Pseudomonadota bacterium]|jgi:uncharacterized SAM-binding protein YcdF (DUF218 family)
MLFVLSKLSSAITQPMFWLALWWALALLILMRKRRTAAIMLWSGLVVLGVLGFRALPDALLRPLEGRYTVPSDTVAGRHVGIIVLGGAIGHPDSFAAHGQVPLGEAAERMTVPVALMRKYPRMELVFSGGEGRLWSTGVTESDLARRFFQQQGLDMSKVRLEDGSRTTRENAQQVARMLGERCQQPWLLLTSAWHMPRSMTEFKAVGCTVTPYPVDFRTGESTPFTEYSLAHSLLRWQTALHEWLGALVYRLTR